MKKKLLALVLAATLLLCSCEQRTPEETEYIIVNAEGYTGETLQTDAPVNVKDPLQITKTVESGIPITGETTTAPTEEEPIITDTLSQPSQTTSPVSETVEPSVTTSSATVTNPPVTMTPSETSTVTTAPVTDDTPKQTTAKTSAPFPFTTTEPVNTVTGIELTVTEAPEEQIGIDSLYVERVTFPSNSYRTLNYEEVKAVWISYIELQGILTGKSSGEFRESIGRVFDNCLTLGINTVYVHLRPFGDAIYSSNYYPWSKYVTGSIGKAPSYDPLQIMLEEAHSRSLSFQGYINPLRTSSVNDINFVDEEYATGRWYADSAKLSKYIVEVNGYYWLNPAYTEVINLICDGVGEIVSNYDVDGIIIDDSFYPTTSVIFDSEAFMESGYSSIYDFRIAMCSNMVNGIYGTIKGINSSAKFGVSPTGSIDDNYNFKYADVKTWCSGGPYIDYIAPQLYYGFENPLNPYEDLLSTWDSLVKGTGVKLIPALGVYLVGTEDPLAGKKKNEWVDNSDILLRQLQAAQSASGYGGISLYSYNYLFNGSYVTDAITAEIKNLSPLLLGVETDEEF